MCIDLVPAAGNEPVYELTKVMPPGEEVDVQMLTADLVQVEVHGPSAAQPDLSVATSSGGKHLCHGTQLLFRQARHDLSVPRVTDRLLRRFPLTNRHTDYSVTVMPACWCLKPIRL